MPNFLSRIKRNARRMYPDGRAFKMPFGGTLELLHAALALSEERAYTAALSVLDSAIADNPNFTADDATDWERRLGLIGGGSLPDRILAINQKLNFPGTAAPRQYYLFIQDELRAAGFNVYVYENRVGGVTKTPEQILGTTSGAAVHAPTVRHSPTLRHGGRYNNKIVNYIDEAPDASFVIGGNYRSTFYISGATITTFANVPAARKAEFRQLILSLKPVQMVGFLFVNYV